MKFDCSGCGLCCRNVSKAVERAKEAIESGQGTEIDKKTAKFPYKEVNGVCEQYDKGCKVYDSRPLICNVKKLFKLTKGLTLKEWYSENGKTCNTMIGLAGLDKRFLVNEKY